VGERKGNLLGNIIFLGEKMMKATVGKGRVFMRQQGSGLFEGMRTPLFQSIVSITQCMDLFYLPIFDRHYNIFKSQSPRRLVLSPTCTLQSTHSLMAREERANKEDELAIVARKVGKESAGGWSYQAWRAPGAIWNTRAWD